MTFEVRPYPEFAWSISRQRKLDRCPRAYFYTYYLHWNGWLDDAPTEARVAYRLGKLTSLDALLGQQIDVRARELEAAARAGAALPEADELETRTREALRQLWAQSKERPGRLRGPAEQGDHAPLALHGPGHAARDGPAEPEGRPVDAGPAGDLALGAPAPVRRCRPRRGPRLRQLPARRRQGLRGARPRLRPARASCTSSTGRPAARTTPTPRRSCCRCGGPSRPIRRSRGRPRTAASRSAATWSTWPPAARSRSRRSPTSASEAAETVRAGVAQMRALLADPEQNIPLEMAAFERRESGLCRSCNFFPICA